MERPATVGEGDRGFTERDADDPERAADALASGRRGGGPLAGEAMTAALGASGTVAGGHGRTAPPLLRMEGKAPLRLLDDAPLVAETPETLLDDDVTPADRMFVRNNGTIPAPLATDPKAWRIRVDGEVDAPLDLSLGEVEARFEAVTLRLQMECGGNGRSGLHPPTPGVPWGNGAISNAEWTGVRLRDLLRAAGLKDTARHTGHFGADRALDDPDRQAMSRGMPVEKAMDDTTLVAFRMNGAPLPHLHGHPVRLVVPGWPGSLSQKWLTRIALLREPHTGPGMGGTSYRLPTLPLAPGTPSDGRDFADMTSMPVRSVLTNLAAGTRLPSGTRRLSLRGHAWAGDLTVSAVHASADFGATWTEMAVAPPPNRHAWQRWSGALDLPSDGHFEVWYRATDSAGRSQPHVAGNWNPGGYGANAMGRVAVLVG